MNKNIVHKLGEKQSYVDIYLTYIEICLIYVESRLEYSSLIL